MDCLRNSTNLYLNDKRSPHFPHGSNGNEIMRTWTTFFFFPNVTRYLKPWGKSAFPKKTQLSSSLHYLFPVTFRHSMRLHSNEALRISHTLFWMQDSHISEKLKRDQINEHIESYYSLYSFESILGMEGMGMETIHFSFTTYHLILILLQYVT